MPGLFRYTLHELNFKKLFLWKFKKMDCFGTKFIAMTVQWRLMSLTHPVIAMSVAKKQSSGYLLGISDAH